MGIDKSIEVEKGSFLTNVGLFLSAREKVLNDFKSRIFPMKDKIPTPASEPAPESALEIAPEPVT